VRSERQTEGPDDRLVVAGLGVAALGPLVVASLLVIVRDHIAGSNAALVFVIVVVLAAALGGRWAGFTAAIVSAMSYDFFLTRPYGSLKIDEAEDIVATALLLTVGLIVGEVVVWAHRGHQQSKRGQAEIARLVALLGVVGADDGVAAAHERDAHTEERDDQEQDPDVSHCSRYNPHPQVGEGP
jgi:K+-sensing histidine kinase KdpD